MNSPLASDRMKGSAALWIVIIAGAIVYKLGSWAWATVAWLAGW